jgi:hypothetical protein
MSAALFIILKIAWALLALASTVITLFLFAFADSPNLGRTMARLFYPTAILGFIDLATGAWLLNNAATGWHILLAFALPLVPPMFLIAVIRRAQ